VAGGGGGRAAAALGTRDAEEEAVRAWEYEEQGVGEEEQAEQPAPLQGRAIVTYSGRASDTRARRTCNGRCHPMRRKSQFEKRAPKSRRA
jgi:hypothetical protein